MWLRVAWRRSKKEAGHQDDEHEGLGHEVFDFVLLFHEFSLLFLQTPAFRAGKSWGFGVDSGGTGWHAVLDMADELNIFEILILIIVGSGVILAGIIALIILTAPKQPDTAWRRPDPPLFWDGRQELLSERRRSLWEKVRDAARKKVESLEKK